MKTIYTPFGKPYISIFSQENTVSIKLHEYDPYHNIEVIFDKKCIPELIETLKDIEKSND